MPNPSSLLRNEHSSSLLAGFGAFAIWGFLALYWWQLGGIPATEILAHRIFWSLLSIAPIIWLTQRLPEVRAALAAPRVMGRIALSALIIAGNWGLYIWAITHDRVLEASLGYYINPLINVVLGRLFLGERLTRLQALAVSIATLGVLWSVAAYGQIPWVALLLALSFGLYGLCRKTVAVESAPGLFLEALLLFPLAALWLLWLGHTEQGHFMAASIGTQLLLMGTGIVTAVPLLLFAYAARHMKLATLGLLQYLSPTINFVLGVYVFREPVTQAALVTFACIWTALSIYTWSSVRRMRGLPG